MGPVGAVCAAAAGAAEAADGGATCCATQGTAARIRAAGLPVTSVPRISEEGPTVVDVIVNKEISLLIITVDEKRSAIADSRTIRLAALAARIPFYTTIAGAEAALEALCHMDTYDVYSLQGLHQTLEVTQRIVERERVSSRNQVGSAEWAEPGLHSAGLRAVG